MGQSPEIQRSLKPPPLQRQVQRLYNVQFRKNEKVYVARAKIYNLKPDNVVMVKTDKGLEPALVRGCAALGQPLVGLSMQPALLSIVRKGSADDEAKYEQLIADEQAAFAFCQELVKRHELVMKLIRVERYFDGSKMIFYFTAESRVDFRGLVRDLVRDFKTRIEMRQIGVRHEAKMVGGLGCCGRELCCTSFLSNFVPVSIKMAKEQNLPLNPAKISGNCNRLLCCLTYEFEAYAATRKGMPKVGKSITLEGQTYKVIKRYPLQDAIGVLGPDDKEIMVFRDEWEAAKTPK